jgi:hypothetical protein
MTSKDKLAADMDANTLRYELSISRNARAMVWVRLTIKLSKMREGNVGVSQEPGLGVTQEWLRTNWDRRVVPESHRNVSTPFRAGKLHQS